MTLYDYVSALAKRHQDTWELSERLYYRNLADTAPCEDTKRNCRAVLSYMAEGLHDYRRNYRADETGAYYRVIHNCNVTGLPMVDAVVSKETGDVARHTTELINEPHFAYNLLDPRSREACLAIADYTGDYLK